MVQIARITSSASSNNCAAFVEVHAQRGELPLQVAHADREREPSVRQQVQCRTGFRHHERIPVRQHHDVRDQPQGRVRAAANPIATNGSSASCPPDSSHRCVGAGWSVNPKP